MALSFVDALACLCLGILTRAAGKKLAGMAENASRGGPSR